ncbi:hypothetical protein C8D03_3078 [Bosea sp. 124]|nr:hypothetical protein C8D03_3078 [Bosea sp. 124]
MCRIAAPLVLLAWVVVAACEADDIVLWETGRWHYWRASS